MAALRALDRAAEDWESPAGLRCAAVFCVSRRQHGESMSIWEWSAAGILFAVVVVVCVRLMRKGLSTLEEERAQCMEQIRRMEGQVREDQKNMPSSEHFSIARSGVEDLLRLAGNPPDSRIEVTDPEKSGKEQTLLLHLAGKKWRISLNMREQTIRSRKKIAYGNGRWRLTGPDFDEEYCELALLMRAVQAYAFQGIAPDRGRAGAPDVMPRELPQFERRFSRRPQERAKTLLPGRISLDNRLRKKAAPTAGIAVPSDARRRQRGAPPQ